MPAKTASDRQAVARIAAHTRWSRENNRAGATSAARRGFMARFEREVDPNNELSPTERARRAESAMRAHMTRLSRKRKAA